MTSFVMLTCDLTQRMRSSLSWLATQRMHWDNGDHDEGREVYDILLFRLLYLSWIEHDEKTKTE